MFLFIQGLDLSLYSFFESFFMEQIHLRDNLSVDGDYS